MRCIPILFIVLGLVACEKDTELVPDNDAPFYDGVSDVRIRNYINRCYIDLIGREPLDAEMDSELGALKAGKLSAGSREAMLLRLQTDTAYLAGDGSFRTAYCQRFYEQMKARFIEAASDAEIGEIRGPIAAGILSDSLQGNWQAVAEKRAIVAKLDALLATAQDYRSGLVSINGVCARMLDNAVYDQINMNTFNFVNASFDDMLFRYPTGSEFEIGYRMIEDNQAGALLGMAGQSKADYVGILTNAPAFYEGMVIYAFRDLLQRFPTTVETYHHLVPLSATRDFQHTQREIMKTDEYAQFN